MAKETHKRHRVRYKNNRNDKSTRCKKLGRCLHCLQFICEKKHSCQNYVICLHCDTIITPQEIPIHGIKRCSELQQKTKSDKCKFHCDTNIHRGGFCPKCQPDITVWGTPSTHNIESTSSHTTYGKKNCIQ